MRNPKERGRRKKKKKEKKPINKLELSWLQFWFQVWFFSIMVLVLKNQTQFQTGSY
jgi:hypothetical protein